MQKIKEFYREGAKSAKDVKIKTLFVLIQEVQAFLRDLRVFAVPRFFCMLASAQIFQDQVV